MLTGVSQGETLAWREGRKNGGGHVTHHGHGAPQCR
jgi:hypothetical protein